jgi:hypothetical protein
MLQGVASLVIIWDAGDNVNVCVKVGVFVEMKKGKSRQQYIGRARALLGFGLTHIVKLP